MARVPGDLSFRWGAAAQELGWTAAVTKPDGLAAGAITDLSDELDLTGFDNVLDVLISTRHRTVAGSVGSEPVLRLFAAAPADGTNYPSSSGENLLQVGRAILVEAAGTTGYSNQYSLAQAFGGVLPASVKVALENTTGLGLSATAGDTKVYYQIVYGNQEP